MHILIRAPNWLGDCVMSKSIILYLLDIFSRYEVSIFCKSSHIPIFEDLKVNVFAVSDDTNYLRRFFANISRMKDQNPTAIVLLAPSFRVALESYFANIPIRVGYSTDYRGCILTHKLNKNYNGKIHQVDSWFVLAEKFSEIVLKKTSLDKELCKSPSTKNIDNVSLHKKYHPKITIKEEFDLIANRLFKKINSINNLPVFAIAPFSAENSLKRWPLDSYKKLVSKIIENKIAYCVLIAGPENEKEAIDILLTWHFLEIKNSDRIGSKAAVFMGNTYLGIELCSAFFRYVKKIIANDSGLSHLADINGVDVVGIFGPTLPQTTGPRWSNNLFITSEHMSSDAKNCTGCYKKKCIQKKQYENICMKSISVESVYKFICSNKNYS